MIPLTSINPSCVGSKRCPNVRKRITCSHVFATVRKCEVGREDHCFTVRSGLVHPLCCQSGDGEPMFLQRDRVATMGGFAGQVSIMHGYLFSKKKKNSAVLVV